MDQQTRGQVARDLLAAYASKEPLEPLTATHDGMTLEDAYAIQLLQVEELLGRGRTVKGLWERRRRSLRGRVIRETDEPVRVRHSVRPPSLLAGPVALSGR